MNETVDELLKQAVDGDEMAMNELFDRYRNRLRRMVRLRLNRRLQGRVDESDVIQDAFLEVARCLSDYLVDPKIPFFLWLRHITGQKIITVHRQHLGAKIRDANREISIYRGAFPEATSVVLAEQLMGKLTSPSLAFARAEMKIRLQEALNGLETIDREVLALRHFEQLTNAEAAHELGITEAAASKRYIRALERLGQMASELGEFTEKK